ncbi:hypothetical protein [Thermococcus sp.]
MRSRTKRRIIPLAVALVLAIVGAALAVPQITLNVQQLGAGSSVITSSVGKANITWVLNPNNPDYIFAAKFTLNATINGTVIVKIYDSTGNLVAYNSTTLTNSNSGTVYFNTTIGTATFKGVPLSDAYKVYLIYQGP